MIISKPRTLNYLLIMLLLTLLSCSSKKDKSSETPVKIAESTQYITVQDLNVLENGLSKETIVLKTAYGNIAIQLYPNKAPNTITRVLKLVQDGFYDGLSFHRVVSNFVIQTGDPIGDGTGGSGQKLKAEFNDLQHILGTVAMARAQDKDSADSQFYIALSTLPHLDGNYTIFGQVSSGLEFLNQIVKGDKIISATIQR